MVETNRGTFSLSLKVRDDTSDVFVGKTYPSQEAHSFDWLSKNPKYKTALCFKFHDNGFCPLKEKCAFAQGENELQVFQGYPKAVVPEVVPVPMGGEVNFDAFLLLAGKSLPPKVLPPYMLSHYLDYKWV